MSWGGLFLKLSKSQAFQGHLSEYCLCLETFLTFTYAYILVEGRHRTRNVQWPSDRRSTFARNTYI